MYPADKRALAVKTDVVKLPVVIAHFPEFKSETDRACVPGAARRQWSIFRFSCPPYSVQSDRNANLRAVRVVQVKQGFVGLAEGQRERVDIERPASDSVFESRKKATALSIPGWHVTSTLMKLLFGKTCCARDNPHY